MYRDDYSLSFSLSTYLYFRTGQTRDVQIRRLIVRGSVEEKLLAVQQQKAEMTEGALAVASAEDKSVKIDRMKLLFSR